jgi:hypothetical protein
MKRASSSITVFTLFASWQIVTAVVAGGVLLGAVSKAIAQAAPRIKVARDSRLGLSIKGIGGPQGAEATRILKNDLDLSGWFAIEDNAPWLSMGAQAAAA